MGRSSLGSLATSAEGQTDCRRLLRRIMSLRICCRLVKETFDRLSAGGEPKTNAEPHAKRDSALTPSATRLEVTVNFEHNATTTRLFAGAMGDVRQACFRFQLETG